MMENKFCKTCGQANFPQVTTCAKCGAKLERSAPGGSNPFNNPQTQRQDDPPPTVAVNAGSFKIPPSNQPGFHQTPPNQAGVNQPNSSGKSNKMYWILGGVGGVLVLFFFVAAIAGIGGYIYLSTSSNKEVTRDYPVKDDDDKKTNDDEKDDDTESKFPKINTEPDKKETTAKFTDQQLIEYIEDNKKTVGKYRLESVKPINNDDYFPAKDAGITALYKSGSRRILHNMSMYSDVDTANSDFEKYVGVVKAAKANIVSNENGNLIYRLEGMVFFVFCNDSGGCHQLVSKDGKYISDYYDSYFKK